MTDDDNRLKNIEAKLDDHGKKLERIANTLQAIAVQDERIKNAEEKIDSLWRKWDAMCDPNTGTIAVIKNHQAACPREQIRWMWGVCLTLSVLMLGIGVKLLAGA